MPSALHRPRAHDRRRRSARQRPAPSAWPRCARSRRSTAAASTSRGPPTWRASGQAAARRGHQLRLLQRRRRRGTPRRRGAGRERPGRGLARRAPRATTRCRAGALQHRLRVRSAATIPARCPSRPRCGRAASTRSRSCSARSTRGRRRATTSCGSPACSAARRPRAASTRWPPALRRGERGPRLRRPHGLAVATCTMSPTPRPAARRTTCPVGLYHCVNTGTATWVDVARRWRRRSGCDAGRACRPPCRLRLGAAGAIGRSSRRCRTPPWRRTASCCRTWQDALARYARG